MAGWVSMSARARPGPTPRRSVGRALFTVFSSFGAKIVVCGDTAYHLGVFVFILICTKESNGFLTTRLPCNWPASRKNWICLFDGVNWSCDDVLGMMNRGRHGPLREHVGAVSTNTRHTRDQA